MASTNAGDEIEAVVESEPLEKDNAQASVCKDDSSEISAVAMFDQLIANRGVLTTCEAERHFLTFVKGNALKSSSLRAERAEAEQERLCHQISCSIEEATRLEAALEKTRLDLHAEAAMRKKVEKEKHLLEKKFSDLRQLIISGGIGERALLHDMQEILQRPEETLERVPEPEFRGRLSSMRRSMRCSWSPPHILDRRMEEQVMTGEDLGSDVELPRKRTRSRSVGFHEQKGSPEKITSSVPSIFGGVRAGSHNLEEKTILKSEKCGACGERMKFGKVGLRCSQCRLFLHADCAHLMKASCHPTLEKKKSKTTTSKNLRFASPMLR